MAGRSAEISRHHREAAQPRIACLSAVESCPRSPPRGLSQPASVPCACPAPLPRTSGAAAFPSRAAFQPAPPRPPAEPAQVIWRRAWALPPPPAAVIPRVNQRESRAGKAETSLMFSIPPLTTSCSRDLPARALLGRALSSSMRWRGGVSTASWVSPPGKCAWLPASAFTRSCLRLREAVGLAAGSGSPGSQSQSFASPLPPPRRFASSPLATGGP